MGNKRIYLGRESSKYAKIAGAAIVTITSLFFVLMALGFTITGSDDICLVTPEDPCVSYGKICNTGPDNYDIYNPDEVKLDFSPTVKNYWMFFKDGRVKKQFLYNIGINHSTTGWRYENFTNATKPRADRIYVHRFARYSCQDYMLVGLKENPDDLIKWGIGVGAEYLDPFWYGVGNLTADTSVSGSINLELGSQINITTNISGATTVCVDIDHPDYGDNYTCGSPNANFLFNISYFNNNEFGDGTSSNLFSYVNGDFDEENSANNNSLNISFTGLDTILSAQFSLSGSKGNTFQENYDAVSRSGDASNPANAYDGDWATFASVTAANNGNPFTETLLENYTIPSGVTAAKITNRHFNYNNVQFPIENRYTVYCYNYTSASLATVYSHNQGGGGGNGFTKESTIPSGCMGNNNLQINIFSIARFTGGGSSYVLSYEDSIEWINSTYPSNIKIYINDTLNRQFDSYLNGSLAHTVHFNDSIEDGNITFYEPGTQIKYMNLDKILDVINATINFTGYTYRGDRTDQWNFKHPTYGIDVNESADKFWTQEQVSDTDMAMQPYNLTTQQKIAPTTAWSTPPLSGDAYQIADSGGLTIFDASTPIAGSCWLYRAYEFGFDDILDNTREYLRCDTFGSGIDQTQQSIDNPFTLGDVGRINSTHGMFFITDDQISFKIFPFTDTSTTSTVSLTGAPGPTNLYGIDGGDTASTIWTIRRQSSTEYYISQWGIDGVYAGYEFLLLNTDAQKPRSLSYDDGSFYVLNDDNTVSVYTNDTTYTSNLRIDFGTDGSYEYEGLDITLNDTEITVDLNTTSVNNYKNSPLCSTSSCVIPVSFSVTQGGIINYDNIYFIQNLSQLNLNETVFQDILSGTINEQNISMNIEAINGQININDIDFDYLGGNDTIDVFSWEQGNRSNNDTLGIINYFSNWNYSFPSFINWLEFIPFTSMSKNITPYGQSADRPILNITNLGFGGMNSNFSIYLNETDSCVNLTISNTSTKTDGTMLTVSWLTLLTDFGYLETGALWMWADYGCNDATWRLWQPELSFRSCCEDCICSEDI